MRRRLILGAIGVSAAVAIAACAGGAARGAQPSWRRSSAGASGHAQRIEFAPAAAPAVRYNDPQVPDPPSSELGDAVVKAVQAASKALSKPAPQADARLFAAAQALAEVAPDDAPLAYNLVEFAMQHNGIIEPSPQLIVMWGPADDPKPIVDKLSERLSEILEAGEFSRVGVGTARRGKGGEAVTVLALQSSFIETRPIPRSLPDGGTIDIDGKVRAPYADPQLFVTEQSGAVHRPSMTRIGAAGFRSKVSCDDRRGRLQIEITAVDASGSTVMANFPVWCNETAPEKLVLETTEDDEPVTDAREAEARMADMINADRERHGLSRLELDSALAQVALGHSEDMLHSGVVAHVSPTTGSAADRANAAGIKSTVILENVARAYGLSEAQNGLMNSPGHRANILAPEATHMGIGIMLGEQVAGRRELFVTQMFIRRPQAMDGERARAAAEKAVIEARSLTPDERLSSVAGELARAVAGGEASDVASKKAAARLRKMKTPYAAVTTVVTAVAAIESFEPASATSDSAITHFGVGVAQGSHPVIGEGAIYVVLLLAKP